MPLRDAAIRVLLANLPERQARAIQQLIEEQTDMQLLGHARDNWELIQQPGGAADVIILGAPAVSPMPGICTHLFAEWPAVRFLVIDPTGARVMQYWLDVQQMEAPSAAGSHLLSAIRDLSNAGF